MYSETLTLDRTLSSVTYLREFDAQSKIADVFYLPEKLPDFLDEWSCDPFSIIKGNPPDAVDDPNDLREYQITVYRNDGSARIITGFFDAYGLPADWSKFAGGILELIDNIAVGNLLNAHYYAVAKERKIKLIIYKVMFKSGGKTYCYLGGGKEYNVGDKVIVPVGKHGRRTYAEVVSIEHCGVHDAPYPVSNIKKIIGKAPELPPDMPPILYTEEDLASFLKC